MVGYACLFIESLSADRVGAYCIRLTKRYQRWRGMSRFRPLRGRLWGVFDTPLRPGTCESSKNGSVYATDGGVWWGVCNTPLRLGTCCPSKNCPVFVPFGAACGAYAIRPTDRVCAILRNTDAILQLGMCGPSKNHPVFVPFGAACGAYSIRPYNRVCAILQNTDAIPQPDTCNPSKYRYDLLTEGAGVFGMWGGGGYRLRGRRA